jgi:hypothetical protein
MVHNVTDLLSDVLDKESHEMSVNRYMLKVRIKALASEARIIRKEENKYLFQGRELKGKYRKRHKKGEPAPVAPEAKVLKDETKRDDYIDEAYARFWNLERQRKETVRIEARASQLVDTFLRGHSYARAENTGTHHNPDFDFLMDFAAEHTEDSDNEFKAKFTKWREEAEAFIKSQSERRAAERKAKLDGDGGTVFTPSEAFDEAEVA